MPRAFVATCFYTVLASASFAVSVRAQSTEDSVSAPIEKVADKTHVGGYGQIEYYRARGAAPRLDIDRFVIYLDHYFSDKWAMKSETEIEHVKLTAEGGGELSIEQAYLDFHAMPQLGWRAGLLVLPIGAVNQTHEPPTFLSVERPQFDQQVIPTTWREIGTGIYGTMTEGLAYQLYVSEGILASGFGFSTLEEIKQEGADGTLGSDATHPGFSAKLDWIPASGLRIGISDYFQPIAQTSSLNDGRAQSFNAAVLDARYNIGGLKLRGEAGLVSIGNSEVTAIPDSSGALTQSDISPLLKSVSGGYLEAGYDLLPLVVPASVAELTIFTRFERFQFKPGVFPKPGDHTNTFTYVTSGLAFTPVDNVIFKADYRLDAEHDGSNDILELGAGFAF